MATRSSSATKIAIKNNTRSKKPSVKKPVGKEITEKKTVTRKAITKTPKKTASKKSSSTKTIQSAVKKLELQQTIKRNPLGHLLIEKILRVI